MLSLAPSPAEPVVFGAGDLRGCALLSVPCASPYVRFTHAFTRARGFAFIFIFNLRGKYLEYSLLLLAHQNWRPSGTGCVTSSL